ncbi:MAG: diguanylate cyclase [Anaerolineales bacterium]|nr:diguanylate cyclase [Anaerolineales bacterium]
MSNGRQRSMKLPFKLTDRTAWLHILGGLMGYALLVYWLEPHIGSAATSFSVFPMLIGAWYYGILGGILTALVVVLLGSVILTLQSGTPVNLYAGEALFGTSGLLLLAIIAGYASRLLHQYRTVIQHRVHVAENLERQATFLALLTNITSLVLESDDIQSVLETLAANMCEIFEADDCLISMWDEEKKIPVPTVAHGPRSAVLEKMRFKKGDISLAKLALQDNKVLALDNHHEHPQEINLPGQYASGSILTLPLRSGKQKLGVLLLLYNQPRTFSADKIDYATFASQQLSLAIAKTYLLDTARQQLTELEILHQIAIATSTFDSVKSLSKQVVKIISEYFYSDHLGILLVNEAKQTIQVQALYHSGEMIVQYPHISLDEGISGLVVKSGKTICVPDVSAIPEYYMVTATTRSEICVPIKIGSNVLGMINAESNKLNAFSKKDEDFLSTVANQLSIAFDRLQASEKQRRRAEEIQHANRLIHMLTQVAAQMETTSNPDDVMQIMGEQLQALGWHTLITLVVPGGQDLIIRYTSIDPDIIQKFERLSNRTLMHDFKISVGQLPDKLNIYENTKASIIPDHIDAIENILKGFPREIIERLLKPVGMDEKMLLGHFPLVFQDKILGFLWLWGRALTEKDMPTLSLFANQVAAALENARLFADVQRLAVTDSLTGLHTRRNFFELAFEEFYRARRYGHPLSIIMLDLDHFKKINDRYGHSAGDVALEKAASICKRTLRNIDLIGRYGGEEFIVLLVETTLMDAKKTALRLSKAISAMTVSTPKGEIKLTVSGGVAGDNVEKINLIDMIELADQALYAAKKAGRNNIQVAIK